MCIALTYILVNLLASVVLGEELLTLPLDPSDHKLHHYDYKSTGDYCNDNELQVYEFQEVVRFTDEDGYQIEKV